MKVRGFGRVLKVVYIMLLVGALLPLQANLTKVVATSENWIDSADTSWYLDNPTATSFSISSAQQLAGLAKLVNDGTDDFSGQTINITADIDLTGNFWTPIGAYYHDVNYDWYSFPFKGTFNGNNWKVSNISIASNKSSVGLFGYVNSAMLTYLDIENVSITTTNYSNYIGSLVGRIENSIISDVDVTGTINITSDGLNIGGLIGILLGSYIENSSVIALTGSSISGDQEVGGLVGTTDSYYSDIDNEDILAFITTSHTDVYVEASSGKVGGLVGTANQVDISQSYSTGSVLGKNYIVGGFIGELFQGTVINSYSTGSVTLGSSHTDWSIVGGFVGLNAGIITNAYSVGKVTSEITLENDFVGGFVASDSYGNGTVTNGYWDMTSSGQNTSAQGTGKFTSDMKLEGTFVDWDFSGIWMIENKDIDNAVSYPFFSSVNKQNPAPGHNEVVASFAGGDGSENDPYQITTVEQLDYVRLHLNKYFILNNDLDLSSVTNWSSIGSEASPFLGKFNGNGKKIDKLTIDASTTDYIGLFGSLGLGSEVKNLNLTNVNVKGRNIVGGLAGQSRGLITGVKISGIVVGVYPEEGASETGGLVGRNSFEGEISYSSSNANVTGDNCVGGLIGYNIGSITRSFATGKVTGQYTLGGLVGLNGGSITISFATGDVHGSDIINSFYVGGLVGSMDFESSEEAKYQPVIVDAYAHGNVYGSDKIGGLVGSNSGGKIKNTYSIGKITILGSNTPLFVGGLVGWTLNPELITFSFFLDQTESINVFGNIDYGTPESLANLRLKSTFTDVDWDFVKIWLITPTNTQAKPTPYFLTETSSGLPDTGENGSATILLLMMGLILYFASKPVLNKKI